MKKRHNYVKVIWRDISGMCSEDNSSAWLSKKLMDMMGREVYNHEHVSIGEIVVDNKDFIVLAATTDDDTEDPLYSDASMIPKSVIIRTEKLKEL